MSDNKTLINETTGNIDLEHAYKAAILFSAHFRYMAEDWSLGRTCLDADLNMQMNEAYERFVLYYLYQNPVLSVSVCSIFSPPPGVLFQIQAHI